MRSSIICLLISVLALFPLKSFAFNWSVNEYIENCSIVYQESISVEEAEIVGYCMGVLKGALAGIVVKRMQDSGVASLPSCISIQDMTKFWEVQKDVLAVMRLNFSKKGSAALPSTANGAVAFSLMELYPCLKN